MQLTFNNGVLMPALGFGVYQIPPDKTAAAVSGAFEVGYRMIDTAASYDNERAVGQAVRDSVLARVEVFCSLKSVSANTGSMRPCILLTKALASSELVS